MVRFFALLLLVGSLSSAMAVQDGVVEQQVGQGVNGAAMGVAYALYTREFFSTVPVSLILVGTGIYAPRKFADTHRVTPATARFVNFMSVWGVGLGATTALMLDSNSRGLAGWILLLDLTTTISSYAYLHNQGTPTSGQTSQIASGALYGAALGMLLVTNPLTSDGLDDVDEEVYGLALFLGQSIGLGAGFAFAESENWSRQRMLALDLSLLGGFAFGYGIGALFDLPYAMRWSLGVVSMAAAGFVSIEQTKGWQLEDRSELSASPSLQLALPSMRFSF